MFVNVDVRSMNVGVCIHLCVYCCEWTNVTCVYVHVYGCCKMRACIHVYLKYMYMQQNSPLYGEVPFWVPFIERFYFVPVGVS